MTARRDPGGERRRARPSLAAPLSAFLSAESSRFLAEMRARTADDTIADDCAIGFLSELDEALWILDEVQEADENAFEHAPGKPTTSRSSGA